MTPGSPLYAVRWRVVYGDGRQVDELPEGSSIMDRWPEQVSELHLIDLTGQSFQRVIIPQGSQPVFYRRKSMGHNAAGEWDCTPRLDVTVFGYGREDDAQRVDGKLWVWTGSRAVNCPEAYIAPMAINMQIGTA